jgi:hypothetical protein
MRIFVCGAYEEIIVPERISYSTALGRGTTTVTIEFFDLGSQPKVNSNSHSTPITLSRRLLKALFECHSCLVINYRAINRCAHNPKAGGSNPSPATITSSSSFHYKSRFDPSASYLAAVTLGAEIAGSANLVTGSAHLSIAPKLPRCHLQALSKHAGHVRLAGKPAGYSHVNYA